MYVILYDNHTRKEVLNFPRFVITKLYFDFNLLSDTKIRTVTSKREDVGCYRNNLFLFSYQY